MNNITFEKFHLDKYDDYPIVTDNNIAALYGICGDNVYLLPQGEQAKCFEQVQRLCSWFLSRNLGRNDTVVAVGGGSIGDTVGFAASIYKRGVNILHVPTTLLAQVDSSIGGKTAIDLDGVKNAVGMFHYGDTLIDTRFLYTLDDEQLLNGKGEILKYRMLSEQVEQEYNGSNANLDCIIRACVKYKQFICDQDPFDKGIRSKLNFGHTIGHALELAYNIPHGVAVANGIYYETKMAARLGICSTEYAQKWTSEVESSDFKRYTLTKEILARTLNDKKNANGKVCFVLPEAFNEAYFTLDEVEKLLL